MSSKKPDEASRVAGLASILKSSNKPKDESPPSPAPQAEVAVEEVPSPAPRRKSQRVGKYRDPRYHQYGVYLRKDTHKRAVRRLEDTESKQDLSDLVQMLLEQWLASDQTSS